MEFYSILSKHYDEIFGLKEKAVQFIKQQFPRKDTSRLLDIASGTGSEAIALAEEGYEVTAADLNEEMVKIMERKTNNLSLPIEVIQMDMRNASDLNETKYDGIYCIGNSFVHLQNDEEMKQVLSDFYDSLKIGGKVIIQIVNFDKIKDQDGMALPLIKKDNPPLTFKRHYTEKGTNIIFHMSLELHGDDEDQFFQSETTLKPLSKQQFVSLIEASPFSTYTLYGDFKGNPYTLQSPALIAVLEKN